MRSKLPGVGTTIFTVMSRMAQEFDAINLSQGFPDFDPPSALLDLLDKYAREGKNQYPPMAGVPYLCEQIALKNERLYRVCPSPGDEITVTSGGTEAIFVAIQAFIHAGDEAIIFDPAFDSYEPGITMAGGRTVHVPLHGEDFRIDWVEVEDRVSSSTRLIIINSPHNPTGTMLSDDDLETLAVIANRHDLIVLSDEVYEHMTYDGRQHRSILEIDALRERSVVVSSFGKTCHATGWKVAYAIACPALTAEFRKVHQFVTFTTHTPSQWALAEFLDKHAQHYLDLPDFYETKRNLFNSALADSAFRVTPSAGTYFQLAWYNKISDLDDVSFANYLTQQVKVAAIPISVFYADPPPNKVIRLCFAKDNNTLAEAAARLCQVESGMDQLRAPS